MQFIIFLGNIGAKYEKTRHNAGFLCGDYLQRKWDFGEWKETSKFFGSVSEGVKDGEKIIFLKPSTLMNRSGKALLAIKDFYKIPRENILIIHDDKDMEFGKVRFRESGKDGGHKGLRDCMRVLGTEEIKRIKIGVDNPDRELFASTSDFVLAKFTDEELDALSEIFEEVEEKIGNYL